MSNSHIFSPCIVARTFLFCFIFRNSRNQMPCQVPVASFPFDIGTLTLAPIRDDLMCACNIAQSAICPPVMDLGLVYRHIIAPLCIVPVDSFSGCPTRTISKDPVMAPSPHPKRRPYLLPVRLRNAPLSSLTMPSNASLMSALTSSSQFSFIDSAQLVCCRKRCSSPHFMPVIWGSDEVIWSVTRWEPRPREGSVRWCWV